MLYTSIAGEKDTPRTDIPVFTYDRFVEPRLNAKIAKILPHLFMDCEYSVWIDGNMFPLKSEAEYLTLLKGNDIAVLHHPERSNVFDEAEFCVRKGKDTAENVEPQIARYRNEGFDGRGLKACGFIIRKHTPKMKQLCEKWWAEICAGSSRDQISFPYVFREGITTIEKNVWSNDLYTMKPHL